MDGERHKRHRVYQLSNVGNHMMLTTLLDGWTQIKWGVPGAERSSSPTAAVNRCSALQIRLHIPCDASSRTGGRRFAWSDLFGFQNDTTGDQCFLTPALFPLTRKEVTSMRSITS